MSITTHSNESARLAVPVAEVAKILGISVRHVWGLSAQGRFPRPIHFGRAARWNIEEIRAWIEAGAPDITIWEETR